MNEILIANQTKISCYQHFIVGKDYNVGKFTEESDIQIEIIIIKLIDMEVYAIAIAS